LTSEVFALLNGKCSANDHHSTRPSNGRQTLVMSPGDEFELIIFDCDGVLVDSEVLAARCLSRLLTQHGMATSVNDVFHQYLGGSFKTVQEAFQRVVGRPLPNRFQADFMADLAHCFATSLKPVSGIEAVLAGLTTPSCVASSSQRQRIAQSLAVTGLDRFGLPIFDGSMVVRGKPEPDLFLYAADRMRTMPDRVLVVEDSVKGVAAAKAAGMTAWGFIGGAHYADVDGKALRAGAGADRVLRDMRDFAAGRDR
jgi:HAD superfamily hydrolase (TIGR01509 family)